MGSISEEEIYKQPVSCARGTASGTNFVFEGGHLLATPDSETYLIRQRAQTDEILKMPRFKMQLMVAILPPDTSTTFLAAIIVPLILGFLVGTIAKGIFKAALAVGVLVLLLMVIGMISPDQIIGPIVSLFRSGSTYATKVKQIAGYLPYSSLTFILGLAVGFFKG